MEKEGVLASLVEANRALMWAWELVAYNQLDVALEAQLEGQINLLSERIRALREEIGTPSAQGMRHASS